MATIATFSFQTCGETRRFFLIEAIRKSLVSSVKRFALNDIKIHMGYQIIYLNGPSSSGKTTLAKGLQRELEPPFLHIGIDKIIGMMPDKLNNWQGEEARDGFSWKTSTDQNGHVIRELQVGPFARKVSDSYLEIVALLARLGHYLIIDDVGITESEFNQWKHLLKEFQVLYVGVKASLPILEQREKARGNRILGSARAQYHKIVLGEQYDIIVDTSSGDLDLCQRSIINKMLATTLRDC
jgi:chloramphenicol 3-O phosphotransferase